MNVKLSKEAVASLPEPGEDGVIRVTCGLKMGQDGSPTLVEVNDMPVDSTEPKEEAAETSGADESESYPDVGEALKGLDSI